MSGESAQITCLGRAGLRVDGIDLRLLTVLIPRCPSPNLQDGLAAVGLVNAIYDDCLVGFLKYARPQALQAIENCDLNRSIDEKIVVQAASGRYEIARYLPHAGETLAIASAVRDGVICCLGPASNSISTPAPALTRAAPPSSPGAWTR